MRFATVLCALVVELVAASTSLSTSASAQGSAPAAPARRPLEGLASQTILVLPAQYVTFADSLGWSQEITSIRDYLQSVDDELTFAFRDHGLAPKWIFADAITKSAQRNVGYVSDPHALDAAQVRIGSKPDLFQLREPLASQLRSLIALNDARYVLIPVEIHFTSAHEAGRITLHAVVIDARRSQIQWMGDITSVPTPHITPVLAADVASKLADLIAPPTN